MDLVRAFAADLKLEVIAAEASQPNIMEDISLGSPARLKGRYPTDTLVASVGFLVVDADTSAGG